MIQEITVMKDKIELVLEALIDWIDADDNPVKGLTKEQLKQHTGLSPYEIKEVIKSLREEGCLIISTFGKTPLDIHEVSISAEGIKKYAKLLARREAEDQKELIFEQLLHPTIIQHAYGQLRNDHLRDAVLNAVIAVFDSIRKKTGLDLDGDNLITKVFSAGNPMLVVRDLDTESGKNKQIGLMRIFQGVYQSIRNPQAHTMNHDWDENKARQFLVFASLLARYVDESVIVNQ